MDQEEINENKLYAKILKKESQILTLQDLTYFPIDYILRCVEGNYQGKQIKLRDLGDEFFIGESDECELSIKNSNIEIKHAKLKYVKDSIYYIIEDCLTKTGTWKKISNLEDYFEINNDFTEFSLFQYKFTIEKDKNILNNEENKKYVLKFIEGNINSNQKEIIIEDGCNLLIGKHDCVIKLDIPCSEMHQYLIKNISGKVLIINKTYEVTNDGLFYKINKNDITLLRGGDIIKLGDSLFRLLTHNWGLTTELGHKSKQEDKYCIIDDLRIFDEIVVPMYAVYDGHGGFHCSVFLQKHFHKNIKDIIILKNIKESKNILVDLSNALQEAIIYTDFCFYEKEFTSPHQGSTCILLIFIANRIISCNLGDSLAILYKNDDTKIFLSKDFKPLREKEQDRIRSKNAIISKDGRLLGQITVSRGFGDWRFKDPSNKDNLKKLELSNIKFNDYAMSNRAEFRTIEINPFTMKYIIIVSDGVFQYSSFQSVFDIINKYMNMEIVEGENEIVNVPSVVDNVRLDIINKIHGSTVKKKSVTADNMTLILVDLSIKSLNEEVYNLNKKNNN